MYLDNQPIVTYTSEIPTVSYFLILNLAVADAATAGFHSQLTPATQGTFEMQVSQVKIRSL
jgi:hypothetical protein